MPSRNSQRGTGPTPRRDEGPTCRTADSPSRSPPFRSDSGVTGPQGAGAAGPSLRRAAALERVRELIEMLDLTDCADRKTGMYSVARSGGSTSGA